MADSNCGYRKVGPNTSTSENRTATKKAHRPHVMPEQLPGSVKSKIASAKAGFGKVMNNQQSWPTYKSK